MRTAPSVQLHPRGTEWLTNGFSLGAGARCELSSMPRGNTQFYHSHLKEPSSRVYQIQQREERVYNSLLTVLGHDWLAHPQWCAPLCFSGPKLHPPTFPFQGPSPALCTFFYSATSFSNLGPVMARLKSHPVFPKSVVPPHPRFVNLPMNSCKFCFLGLLE